MKTLTPDEFTKVKEFCDWAAERVVNAAADDPLMKVFLPALDQMIKYEAANVDSILEGTLYEEIPGAEFVNAGKEHMPRTPRYGGPDFNQPIQVKVDGIHWAKLYFDWGQPTVGFGQASIGLDEVTKKVTMMTEGMGREWMKRALHAAVDSLVDQAEVGD